MPQLRSVRTKVNRALRRITDSNLRYLGTINAISYLKWIETIEENNGIEI